MTKAEKMQARHRQEVLEVAKFKVGDFVKWNDGKHYNDDKRIDVITAVGGGLFGGVEYMTKEINGDINNPHIGKAQEAYLVRATA